LRLVNGIIVIPWWGTRVRLLAHLRMYEYTGIAEGYGFGKLNVMGYARILQSRIGALRGHHMDDSEALEM
jgi:hypothetical protein